MPQEKNAMRIGRRRLEKSSSRRVIREKSRGWKGRARREELQCIICLQLGLKISGHRLTGLHVAPIRDWVLQINIEVTELRPENVFGNMSTENNFYPLIAIY